MPAPETAGMVPAAEGWSDPRTPNLFLVGAPRAGTTGLHDRLAQHPEITMSGLKEPHFFSTDLTQRMARWTGRLDAELERPREDYLALWSGGEGALRRGESSVYYLYSDDAPKAVRAASQDARIVILVREPVALLRSLHRKLLVAGDEDQRSFETALELEDERRAGRRLPSRVRFPEMVFYRDYVRYAHHVRRWQAVFGESRVRVLALEDWNARTDEVWAELQDFLGVARAPLPPPVDENAGVEPRSLFLAGWLAGRLMAVNRRRAGGESGPLFGLGDRAYRAFGRWNERPVRQRALSAALIGRWKAGFTGEVRELEELLGRDLAALWSYPR